MPLLLIRGTGRVEPRPVPEIERWRLINCANKQQSERRRLKIDADNSHFIQFVSTLTWERIEVKTFNNSIGVTGLDRVREI